MCFEDMKRGRWYTVVFLAVWTFEETVVLPSQADQSIGHEFSAVCGSERFRNLGNVLCLVWNL